MSNLELIYRLCKLLADALDILRKQADLLNMHGIATMDGDLERQRDTLMEDIEKSV